MNDIKQAVIDAIDSLIPKGQNSLGLRDADMVYGINKAKEAVEKLFAESSTQTNDSNALNALDTISRQTTFEVLTEYYHHRTEVQHKALREALDRVPSAELQPTCNPDKISQFIDGIEEMFADIRERFIDDSVCGLCEYDGAYVGESGDWVNECPGFEKDDCFKLSDKTRKEWTEEIIKALDMAPSADIPDRKVGKWVLVEYPDGYYHAECSECGEEYAEDLYWHKKARFCPCCGAYMWGEEDDV